MQKTFLTFGFILSTLLCFAQSNPAILAWLQNTTKTGSYYVAGNSTKINNNILVNCQKVQYSANWVYVSTKGIPAYPTGPFQDGNPSQASDQNAIFKISLNPTKNNGTPSPTTGGNIGIFINGVALFDYRDGVAWNTNTNALCGGPGNPPCPGGPNASQSWNRDAVLAERPGFDCSKGHPAMGNYHHHQNPSAFKLDSTVISTVCNLYDADGLYVINPVQHSPLIGFAYDGFPIYGAYGFKNADGTGGIVRMKSGYQLRNITVRTHHADGTDVLDGPAVSSSYPLGYFREDYEFVSHPGQPDYLDVHNGRFCVTPEYPNGIYCYFATVNAKHNSAYPYIVGPTFYGTVTGSKVTSISESVTTYNAVPGFLNVTPDSVMIPSSQNNSGSFNISSNVTWAVSTNQPWLSLNKIAGYGNATISLTTEANPASTPRTAVITISSTGLTTKYVKVIQADSVMLFLNASVDSITLVASENAMANFEITSNTSWAVSSDQIWLTSDKMNGSGNATIFLEAQANTVNSPRTAELTITGVGTGSKIIFVTQLDSTITYTTSKGGNYKITVFPNPSYDLIAIQIGDLVKEDFQAALHDATGKILRLTQINAGQTIGYLDVRTLYDGIYFIKISNGLISKTEKVIIKR